MTATRCNECGCTDEPQEHHYGDEVDHHCPACGGTDLEDGERIIQRYAERFLEAGQPPFIALRLAEEQFEQESGG